MDQRRDMPDRQVAIIEKAEDRNQIELMQASCWTPDTQSLCSYRHSVVMIDGGRQNKKKGLEKALRKWRTVLRSKELTSQTTKFDDLTNRYENRDPGENRAQENDEVIPVEKQQDMGDFP